MAWPKGMVTTPSCTAAAPRTPARMRTRARIAVGRQERGWGFSTSYLTSTSPDRMAFSSRTRMSTSRSRPMVERRTGSGSRAGWESWRTAPPLAPVPPVPLPDLPAMAPLPDAPAIPTGDPDVAPVDPDVPPRPPVVEPEPPPFVSRGYDLPAVPPLEATMITRPESREELVIVHDGQRTPIEAAVVQIGRAPSCDIVLDDRNVSRRHAEIRRRGPVVVLIDLDSTNGTIVNGRRVREHPLADGDRITLGNSRLTFERRTT